VSAEQAQSPQASGEDRPAPPGWQRPAAEDLNALAWLHLKEHAPDVLVSLNANGFPATLALVAAEHPASRAMDAALQALAGHGDGSVPGQFAGRPGGRLCRHLPHLRPARLAVRVGLA
jgi:hypothetical protein